MSYIQGFLQAVPAANKEIYRKYAAAAWPFFEEYGCLGLHENWGDAVEDGEVTSFPKAVKQKEGEVVVFSWMVWPDKATHDAAWQKMMQDPRMEQMGEMPFDGKRMMWGGFEPLFSAEAKVPA